jgi:hypothetical protein
VIGRDQSIFQPLASSRNPRSPSARRRRAGAADIGIETRLVAEASDLDDLVERLRKRAAGKHQARGHNQGCE